MAEMRGYMYVLFTYIMPFMDDIEEMGTTEFIVALTSHKGSLLKPMYSFGKRWKWKISQMGVVYRVVWVLKALWIFLSKTINFLRKLHKTNILGMPQKILPWTYVQSSL